MAIPRRLPYRTVKGVRYYNKTQAALYLEVNTGELHTAIKRCEKDGIAIPIHQLDYQKRYIAKEDLDILKNYLIKKIKIEFDSSRKLTTKEARNLYWKRMDARTGEIL